MPKAFGWRGCCSFDLACTPCWVWGCCASTQFRQERRDPRRGHACLPACPVKHSTDAGQPRRTSSLEASTGSGERLDAHLGQLAGSRETQQGSDCYPLGFACLPYFAVNLGPAFFSSLRLYWPSFCCPIYHQVAYGYWRLTASAGCPWRACRVLSLRREDGSSIAKASGSLQEQWNS